MGKKRRYTNEFKREAVKLVTEQGYTPAEAARSLGIHANLLRNWRKKFSREEQGTETMSETEQEELKRLREEETKKRILRTVLVEIIANSHDDPPQHELHLHWQGGVHTELVVRRNPRGKHGRATDQTVRELIAELSKVCDDRTIASVLNRLGYRTGQGNSWIASRIAQVRYQYRLPNYEKNQGWLTLSQAAEILDVSFTVVRRLIKLGDLPAKQVVKYAPWIIERADLDSPAVQRKIQAIHSGARRSHQLIADRKNCP